ncbi:MAG: hypothetical protein Q7K43_02165, partial [Candidatus Woesearchaeota archaeon]|nr:hypothetical protein [Candidatus Woesearchaeota archaeon]
VQVGEEVKDLVGDNTYVDQAMSVKFIRLVTSGSTTSAVFELYDKDGALVDTRTVAAGSNLKDSFVDKASKTALKSNLNVDAVYQTSAAGASELQGYVEVTKGTDTVELYNGKGYPYDSSATTYLYKVTLTSSSNKFTQLSIKNDKDAWNRDSSNGNLFPTTSGQSLSPTSFGQSLATTDKGKAVFGNGLTEGTQGKGYFSLEFVGIENKNDKSLLNIGGVKDSQNRYGVSYYDTQDQPHKIPFFVKESVSQSPAGSAVNNGSFAFDVLDDKIHYFYSSDTNTKVSSGNYVNGRTWTIAGQTSGALATDVSVPVANNYMAQITVEGYGDYNVRAAQSSDTNVATTVTTFTIDGVQYTIRGVSDNNASVTFDTNRVLITMYDNNSTSASNYVNLDSSDTNTGSAAYGRAYLTLDSVFDSNSKTLVNNPVLRGAADRDYRYSVLASGRGYLFWLLSAGVLGEGSGVIDDSHAVYHLGTHYSTTETESRDTIDANYYLPKSQDVNTSTLMSNTGYYLISQWLANDASDTTNSSVNNVTADYNTYVDTSTGQLLKIPASGGTLASAFNNTVEYLAASPQNWVLKSGTDAEYTKSMYADGGSKLVLNETAGSAEFTLRKNAETVVFVDYGASVSREVQGETLTLTEGETKETSSGTKLTANKINVDVESSVEASEEAVATEYMAAAGLGGRAQVVLDSQSSGPVVIVGGHLVNSLATDVAGSLKAAGDKVVDVLPNGNIVAAGFTAEDTVAAVRELIDLIDGFA